jgi:hypothetical protein
MKVYIYIYIYIYISVLSYMVLTPFGTHFTSFNQTIIIIANEISEVLPYTIQLPIANSLKF